MLHLSIFSYVHNFEILNRVSLQVIIWSVISEHGNVQLSILLIRIYERIEYTEGDGRLDVM